MMRRAAPTARLILPARAGREEWEAARRGGLGGSDIAAVLGMDRYRTRRHVWLEKRGEQPDIPRSAFLEEAGDIGTDIEPWIAQRFARFTGTRIRRVGTLVHDDREWMRVNLDRRVYGCPDGPCFLECKNKSEYLFDEWREDVPDEPALQTHWGMAVAGYQHAHVAALVGGNKFVHYRIERDEELLADLVGEAGRFWETVQDPDADPPPVDGSAASKTLLAHMWQAEPGAIVVLDEADVVPLVARAVELKAEIKATEAKLALAENQLRDLLGPHEIGVDANFKPLVTNKQNGNFAPSRFTAAHPDLAAKCTALVPGLDMDAIKEKHPEEYLAHRARVLRIPKGALQ